LYAEDKIDFSSNDYFGFSKLASLKQIQPAINSFGATGSRSITGNSIEAEETEKLIAAFHNRESALIFNCGYMANVGLFSCIANKADSFILMNTFMQASLMECA
jgi:8-amino-7-oxononanoate synthase